MKNKGELYIIIAAILFGSIGIINKYLAIPPVVQNFYRFLFSTIFLFSVIYFRKEKPKLKKESFLYLILISLGIIGTSIFFATAVKIIPIGTVAFIFYLFPIIIVLFSGIFLKEKITKNIAVALILASFGAFLLYYGGNIQASGYLGYLLSLLAAVCYSIVIIFSKKLRSYYSPLVLAFFQALIVSILLIPVAFAINYSLDPLSIGLLLFLGIIISGIGIILLNFGLGQVTANRAAVLMYIEPVAASILAMIFFRQIPGVFALAGCVLILLADYYIVTRNNA
jgi:drug/metabolite transporter (DMT)-like permease